jgi:hypothetical protein
MKVICVNNLSRSTKTKYNLTIGKTYDVKLVDFSQSNGDPLVKGNGPKYYTLLDDGSAKHYRLPLFKTLDEYRDQQLNRILQ